MINHLKSRARLFNLPTSFSLFQFVAIVLLSLPSQAAPPPLVISEVQSSGFSPIDDAIEIFNPTGDDVELAGWKVLIYGEFGNLDDTLVIPRFTLGSGRSVIISDDANSLYLDDAAIFWQPNEPGACALLDGSVQGIDFVRWHASTVSPPPGAGFTGGNPSGAMTPTMSLGRRIDGVDTNSGADWVIDIDTFGGPNPILTMFLIEVDLDDAFVMLQFDGLEIGSRVGIQASDQLDGGWKLLEEFEVRDRSTTRQVQVRKPPADLWFRAIMR